MTATGYSTEHSPDVTAPLENAPRVNAVPLSAGLDLTACPVPAWLPDKQTQTLFGALAAPFNRIRFVRERVDTPDGDFIDIDWNTPAFHLRARRHQDPMLAHTAAVRWMTPEDQAQLNANVQQPALILLHGLEGSSNSRYAQAITQYFLSAGWLVAVAHFRGCSGFTNRLARAYHSGDSEEISFILKTVRQRAPLAQWHAVGISLGGNALLKKLGETPQDFAWLHAAAAISAPLDLVAAGNHLSDNLFNREVYSRHFLRTLKPKVLEKSRRFPGVIDIMRINQARDLRDFDNAYTAPMHGFKDAADYWQQSSSKPWLKKIQTPTLVLNARNDPFLPEQVLPGPKYGSASVLFHQPALGGHVSFVTGMWPGNLTWLPKRLERFFNALPIPSET
jgi:predicted alpha/beta-fold hydrolase